MSGPAGDPPDASRGDTGSAGAGAAHGRVPAPADSGSVTATAMRILRRLADVGTPLTTGEVATAVGLTEHDVRSLLTRLVTDGFAAREGDRYRLGPRIVELARRVDET